METNKPVQFKIDRSKAPLRFQVIATLSNGSQYPWGTQTTERGAKSCLTRYAKREGFVVTGDTAQTAE